MKICPICNKGKAIQVDDIVAEMDGYLFIVKGERCTACGEEFIAEKEGQQMISIAKKMGLWGEPIKNPTAASCGVF